MVKFDGKNLKRQVNIMNPQTSREGFLRKNIVAVSFFQNCAMKLNIHVHPTKSLKRDINCVYACYKNMAA